MSARRAFALCRVAVLIAVKALAVWMFVVHFLLTAIDVFPDNPVKAGMLPVLSVTIESYARQNWNLFAPDPISTDFVLLAKCLRGPADAGLADAGAADDSGWEDLSLPIWKAFQRNRVSAYDRLARPLTNTLRTYLSGGATLIRWQKACIERKDPEACVVYERGVTEARDASSIMLRRLGSGFCRSTAPAATAVALRARVQTAVPWSKRFEPSFQAPVQDVPVGVYPVDPAMVGSGIYRSGGF
jgi:hypothetical protein